MRRLSRAATEVLAIVAYHEPVSRAEIGRFAACRPPREHWTLMEAGWVRIAGRRSASRPPGDLSTTPEFLNHFGLASLKDCQDRRTARGRACSIRLTTK
ncbi:MAG: SMC-Scp complex subunit ScpB [Sphingomonadaceae bacterium]